MPEIELKPIPVSDFVCLDDLAAHRPLRIDLVYARPDHPDNMFRDYIYRKDAKMWGHKDLVAVIARAAEICHAASGYIFELKDCLRTTEAQARICDSAIVRAHPEWLVEPRLFSPPGKGGHPRGMAVDIVLVDDHGEELDMGTRFDFLTDDKSKNPAARHYTDFGRGEAYNRQVLSNRRILESAMMQAAAELKTDLWPYPEEWWDFRFRNEYSGLFRPVSDADLPPAMRMTF